MKPALIPVVAVIPLVAATLWVMTEESNTLPADTFTSEPEARIETTAAKPKTPETAPPVSAESSGEVSYQTPDSLGEDPFASSLEGTQIDGSLKADANGNLIVDLSTKDFFDYFLNTIGEVAPETALSEMEALARNHLPPAAAKQAMAILDQYLSYKQQTLSLSNQQLDPTLQSDPAYQLQVLKTALGDLKQLRRTSFDAATHEAFFGLEEAYGDYTIATMEIQQREDLSAESKQTLQAWHRRQLPEVIRKTETRMIQEQELHEQRQTAIAEASSPEQAGERLESLGVSSEQAAEVVNYLKEREQFDQRYQQYQQELARLDSSGISSDDYATQQAQLLEQHFDSEQARTWAKLRGLNTQ